MIIALTGPKGSGKDTVGQMIKEMYSNFAPETIAFADPVKDKVRYIFDLENNTEYDLFKRDVVEFNMPGVGRRRVPGRHVVREIGMLMRSYNEKQFTDYVVDKIHSYPSNMYPGKLWIVTDLRFDNEYTVLKNLGAKIIKITRPNYTYEKHITERGFDDHLVDKILLNDGDKKYLEIRVKSVVDSILEEYR